MDSQVDELWKEMYRLRFKIAMLEGVLIHHRDSGARHAADVFKSEMLSISNLDRKKMAIDAYTRICPRTDEMTEIAIRCNTQ